MDSWLRSLERLPSHFARDTEPLRVARPPPAKPDREREPRGARGWGDRLKLRLAREAERQNRGSAAGW